MASSPDQGLRITSTSAAGPQRLEPAVESAVGDGPLLGLRSALGDWLLDPARQLLEAGGPVLWVIFAVSLLLWTLILLRYLDLFRRHPRRLEAARREWAARSEHSSWLAHQVRRALISQLSVELNRSLPLIKALITACPLLGLLGTVTGMIHVFDIMAHAGSSQVKAMADGISLATIPTMAGMVVAISGLFFSADLQRRAVLETDRAADQLRTASGIGRTPTA